MQCDFAVTQDALIVGGGIGGLTAALCLHRQNFAVCVVEQAAQFEDIGAGIQLSANAMHVLRHLGLEDAIAAASFEPQNAVIKDYRGKTLLKNPLNQAHQARYGAPYFHIHRADLVGVLAHAVNAAGIACHMGACVTGYQQTKNKAVLLADDKANNEFEADIIIGADGIHSPIRAAMQGETEARFTGQVAWRGLVSADKLPIDIVPPDATIWAGPGRHFVSYYVRGGAWVNFIAVEERDAWAAEDWQQTGDMADLRTAFDGWDAPVQAIIDGCESCHLWGLFDRTPLAQWQDGRVALLGDACHPMLPFMAQGGAMAIEDGFVLAQKLAAHDNISDGLQSYVAARRPRTTMLQNISRRNAALFHAASPLARAKRNIMLRVGNLIPAATHSRFDPIYGVNVTSS